MGVVFTFPGQGVQRPRMLAALPKSAVVAETLAEAADALDRAVETLDAEDALADTQNVQLALSVAGVAGARHMIAEDAAPDAVMGLSIGAWPAAVIAGVLEFASALKLVAERGRLMAEAYPSGYGMSAVIGLSEARVRRLVDAVSTADGPLYVGNVNSAQQIVVAGHDDGLKRLADAAAEAGAAKVSRLDMAVPSHCALLDAPARGLAAVAENHIFSAPKRAYFSANARRRLYRADAVSDDLVYNMARPVYWSASARIAHESGFELAVEMPPGHVLTGLHPPVEPPGEAVAVIDAGWKNAVLLVKRAREDR